MNSSKIKCEDTSKLVSNVRVSKHTAGQKRSRDNFNSNTANSLIEKFENNKKS